MPILGGTSSPESPGARDETPSLEFCSNAIKERRSLALSAYRIFPSHIGPVTRVPGLYRPLCKFCKIGMSCVNRPVLGKTIAKGIEVMGEGECNALQYKGCLQYLLS